MLAQWPPRPASACAGHGKLDFDPLRTFVGMGQARFVILVVLTTFVSIALLTLLFYFISRFAGA